ncbi:MAG: alpha/beta hydrolase [Comamonas sp.]
MNPRNVLLLPGWRNSGADHWQSRWQALHGYIRVEQHDWDRPLRGDWQIQLEEAVLAAPPGPVVLVAHSLGCALVAAWASHSRQAHRVQAALLVAPPDTSQDGLRGPLPTWHPLVRQPLPFGPGRSMVLASDDDPYCSPELAQALARDWGAGFALYAGLGHINADSGLGDWPQGHAVLERLLALAGTGAEPGPGAEA